MILYLRIFCAHMLNKYVLKNCGEYLYDISII